MLNNIIESFTALDDKSQNKAFHIFSRMLNPVKIYLITVILLLLVMCIMMYLLFSHIKKAPFTISSSIQSPIPSVVSAT
jgi:hypothetical protein